MGWGVSPTPRPPLPLGKTRYPLYCVVLEDEWAPGPVWTGGKSRPHRDSIPDSPVRSQSLYRQNYPAHLDVKINSCKTHTSLHAVLSELQHPLQMDLGQRLCWEMDGQRIGVLLPVAGRYSVQTGCGVQQHPNQWFRGENQPESEANHSTPYCAEVKIRVATSTMSHMSS